MSRYRIGRKTDCIPMPDRGPGVFFSTEKDGEAVDPSSPYYARLIADGDIKLIEDEEEPAPAPKGTK